MGGGDRMNETDSRVRVLVFVGISRQARCPNTRASMLLQERLHSQSGPKSLVDLEVSSVIGNTRVPYQITGQIALETEHPV